MADGVAQRAASEVELFRRLEEIERRLRETFRIYAAPPSRPHRRVVADTLMLVDLIRRAPSVADIEAVEMVAGVLETAQDVRQARRMERDLRLRIDTDARRQRIHLVAFATAFTLLLTVVIVVLVALHLGSQHTLGVNRDLWLGFAFGLLAAGTARIIDTLKDTAREVTLDLVSIELRLLGELLFSICAAFGLMFLVHLFEWAEIANWISKGLWSVVQGVAAQALADRARDGSVDAASGFLSALIGGVYARRVLRLVYRGVTKPVRLLTHRKEKIN